MIISIRKLLIVVLVSMPVLLGIYTYFFSQLIIKNELINHVSSDLTVDLVNLAETVRPMLNSGDNVRLAYDITRLGALSDLKNAILFDEEKVIASSRLKYVGSPVSMAMSEFHSDDISRLKEIKNDLVNIRRSHIWKSADGSSVFGINAIKYSTNKSQISNERTAYLLLERTLTGYDKVFAQYLGFNILGAQLILTLVALAILYRPVIRKLSRFHDLALSVIQNSGSNVMTAGSDELSVAGRSLGHLSDELEETREKLDNQYNFFRNVLDSAAEAIYGIDTNGNITFANRACLNLLAYGSEDELLGKNAHQLIHHTRRNFEPYDAEDCPINMVAKGNKSAHNNSEIFWRKDGSSFDVEYWAVPLVIDRETTWVVITFFDISEKKLLELEQKQTEAALRRSEETYSKAEAIAHIGSWDWNIITGELHWTDEIYRIFGQVPQSFGATYDAFLQTIHPEDRDKVIAAVQEAVENPHATYDIVHRVIRPDCIIRTVHENGKVYRDESGRPRRMIGTVHDISERIQQEQELEIYRKHLEDLVTERTSELHRAQDEIVKNEKLATLGRLTATVSHEIRNPLGAIRPSVYILRKLLDGADEKIITSIERIDRNVQRCDHIIDELLDFTRITVLNLQTVDLNGWLDEVINELAIPDSITVHTDIMASRTCQIDTDRMRRVIINIINNACEALVDNSDDKHLYITATTSDNELSISIRDNGPGIPTDLIEKIYEPLFSTKGFGVGLGLPTVKHIVDQHGGTLDLHTEDGKGTSFEIRIPDRAA